MEKVVDMKKPASGESLEDSEMKGVSSLMKMKESWGQDGADGKGEGLGFVLRGIDMNSEENGDDKPGVDSMDHVGVNGDVPAENGGERAEEVGKPSAEGKNEGGDSVGSEEHGYSVGDFVWGKIKSHPWWPGRVYDSSDASEYALKLRQEGKLLVAYFGDGTFAWCHPSQLKRFEENFEEMMSQSSSKSFLNAVKETVDEIGMLVNLKITCPCARETEQAGPFVANSGVKEGVLLPDKGIKKLGASWIEPTDLLTSLRHKAQVANVATGLELGILKGWILGFYRSKVGSMYKLPEYVEPELIPGLEDIKENAGENSEMGVLSRGPVEEEKEAQKHGASENGTQRKQKSIAEILGANRHSKEKISPRRRKMANLLESSPVVQTGESVEQINESSEAKQEKKRGRKKKIATPGNESGVGGTEASEPHKEKSADKSEVKDSSDKGYMSRERKKSRYLSPPYTNLNKGDKKGDVTAESLRVSGIVYLGERMTKAAENLFGANEKSSPENPTEVLAEQKTMESQPPKQAEGENTIVHMEIKASAEDVLSTVHSLARDPQRRLSIDAVEGFLRDFRSSVYIDNPKSDVKSKEQTGRKRKSQGDVQSELSAPKVRSRGRPKKNSGSEMETTKLHSVPISYGEGQAATELLSPETKPKRKRMKKVKESNLNSSNPKKADESKLSDQESGDKGASLVVSFGPGSSLPSKEELLRLFSKFGSLNESKTDMYYNNFCGKIVFKKTSDAESALESSQKASPFGPASVTYELKQASPKKPKPGSSSQPKKPKKPSSAATQKPEIFEAKVIKERLQVVTSMLDKSNGKLSKKMRAQVEGELKGVLEKISAAGGSSTSA